MGQSSWEQAYALGRRLASKGDVARAEQAFLAAIADAERSDDGSLDLATTLSALAQLKFQARAYEEAESLFRRVLPLREAALGAEHPLVVSAMNNLAAVFVSRDALAEAEPMLERAVAATRKRLQAAQFDLTANINNLVRLYVKRGDFARAEPLVLQLLLMKRPLGPAHPDVAAILVSLAKIRHAMGRTDDAERILRRVLAARERTLPADDPRVIATREDIARLYPGATSQAPGAADRARVTPDLPSPRLETPPKAIELTPRTPTPPLSTPRVPTPPALEHSPTPTFSSFSGRLTPEPTNGVPLDVTAPIGLQSLADAIQHEPEAEPPMAAPIVPQSPAVTPTDTAAQWRPVWETDTPEPPLQPPARPAATSDMATAWENVTPGESRPADGWLDPASGPLSAPPPEPPAPSLPTPEPEIGPGWGAEAQPRIRREPYPVGGRRPRPTSARPKRSMSGAGIALVVAAGLAAVAAMAMVFRPSLLKSLHAAAPVHALRAIGGHRQTPLAIAPATGGAATPSAQPTVVSPRAARPADATPSVTPPAPAATLPASAPAHAKAPKPAHSPQHSPATVAPDGNAQVLDSSLIVPPAPMVPSGVDDAAPKPNDSAKSGPHSFPPTP